MKADSPLPNRVSASPVAYWFVTRPIARAENSSETAMPAVAPASRPTVTLPLCRPAAKPSAAATSIIPSAPRLSTPLRSLTSSPMAASSNGVPAFRVAAISAAAASISRPWRSARA